MRFLILLFLLYLFTGCSVKEYKLFQQKNSQAIPTQELNISLSSKITANDILEIDIINMNKRSNIMMSERGLVTTSNNKYVVYEDGTILLPLLNSVYVAGLTIKELNNMLTSKYKEFLKSPYVRTSVKNHKIYVLGEVSKQGVVALEGESISVIEAIARSGGLTNYALRSHVRVINEENGKYIMHTLNFNNFSTLNSHSLMLKNNSIVYVEPKYTKAIYVTINDYLPILQAISSTLSTFVNIKYLSK
ncbi:Polysaccharide export outer membrane protein [hydrothermal vent metagenome]|uniref:Polysaccharide export outer membrane protein n=1 Tax=hydrothermal vent metagenome TaxID=652676 RepID=A0A1W1BK73_9ZZZZ